MDRPYEDVVVRLTRLSNTLNPDRHGPKCVWLSSRSLRCPHPESLVQLILRVRRSTISLLLHRFTNPLVHLGITTRRGTILIPARPTIHPTREELGVQSLLQLLGH